LPPSPEKKKEGKTPFRPKGKKRQGWSPAGRGERVPSCVKGRERKKKLLVSAGKGERVKPDAFSNKKKKGEFLRRSRNPAEEGEKERGGFRGEKGNSPTTRAVNQKKVETG